MATKSRPDACCTAPIIPVPLSAGAEDQLIAGLKALADPTRLAIFRLIAAQQEPICVCDIVSRFGVSQPTISHHLKVLREAGLTTVSRRGVWAYYAVDQRGVMALRSLFGQVAPAVSDAA
jgi:ArsR family transcriptional regulator, arsenate/arsenite/antimonite-responsive transcriptional repressor